MSGLADWLGNSGLEMPVAVDGVISRAPTVSDDTVHVALPAFDAEQGYGPCGYMPRGTVKPSVGDPCVVVFTEAQNAVVVFFEPLP
jgi:hypothetical protein